MVKEKYSILKTIWPSILGMAEAEKKRNAELAIKETNDKKRLEDF